MKLFPDFAGGYGDVPAAFGRLCVETIGAYPEISLAEASRLRAAVC